jgi:hypothetical protein
MISFGVELRQFWQSMETLFATNPLKTESKHLIVKNFGFLKLLYGRKRGQPVPTFQVSDPILRFWAAIAQCGDESGISLSLVGSRCPIYSL